MTKSWADRRAALDITQRQLAELVGVSVRMIKYLESGRPVPRWLPLAVEAIEARARRAPLNVTPANPRGWPKGKPRKPAAEDSEA